MAGNPQAKALFDWNINGNFTGTHDDASALIGDDPGTEVLAIERGAGWEGQSGVSGSATVRLQNRDNKFTAGYSGSPLAGLILPGVPVRLQAIYNSTTYPLFEGRTNGYEPSPEFGHRVVDVTCDDPMRLFEKRTVSRALDETLSLSEFRAAILQLAGLTSSQYALSGSGPEAAHAPTSADSEGLLDVMALINEATRSIDFIRPLAAGYQYVVKDRTTMIGSAAVKTYAADEAWLSSWGVSDDLKVNYQLVQAEPFISSETEELLWQFPRSISLNAGGQRIRIAKWSDPLILGSGHRPAERARFVLVATGTVTASVTFYSTSARVVINGGASGGDMKSLKIYGYPADQLGLGYLESDRSAGDPAGRYDGGDISNRFLANDEDAQGLADYLTWIGTQPPLARGTVTFKQDLFPDILQREPGEKIIVSDARRGIVNQPVLIESTSLRMAAGGHWNMTAQVRSVPTIEFVQIGGDAAHGIGGSAIIGY